MSARHHAKLNRNLPLSVQPASAAENVRHMGYLVGNIGTRHLVIGGFADAQFQPGETLIVRMMLDNEAVGYRTRVEEMVDSPERLYFVAFPEQVETVNLRKAERLTVFIPADVRAELNGTVQAQVVLLQARVLNLSSGGCCFSAKRSITPVAVVNISFSLPGERHVHSLTGRVIALDSRDALFAQRVRFSDDKENLPGLSEIAKWINQNAAYAIQ